MIPCTAWPPCARAEELRRKRDGEERKAAKEERRRAKAEALASGVPLAAKPKAAPATPIAFLFPGQGSQALGMLNVSGWRWAGGGDCGVLGPGICSALQRVG